MSQTKAPDQRLILASGSPYRRQMLERLGLHFEVLAADIDETARSGENGPTLAARLAREKALAVAERAPGALVIGCDQVAECAGRLLGKPGNADNAVEQLMHCRGKLIVFHSAIAMLSGDRTESCIVPTRIQMRNLKEAEIRNYVERDRPFDCAGAMRSESLGIGLAESMSSDDPTALIGMPLIATIDLLQRFGLRQFQDF